MKKYAYLVQFQEDWTPGWWRYSRPVLRHLTETEAETLADKGARLEWVHWKPFTFARNAQKEWDLSYN